MAGISRRGGKKNRKWGRNKLKCTSYSANRTEEKNKKRKLSKHLKNHPTDLQAFHSLHNIKI